MYEDACKTQINYTSHTLVVRILPALHRWKVNSESSFASVERCVSTAAGRQGVSVLVWGGGGPLELSLAAA